MHITIGMLAYNEADVIETTLRSLLAQSAFTRPNDLEGRCTWELLVVPNGCSDQTHEVAQAALKALVPLVRHASVSYRVETLKQGGKSRSWNELVHRIARADTDVFLMIDTDIEFGHEDTVLNTVRRTLDDSHARVVVDTPLKDFTRKPKMSLIERWSAGMSNDGFHESQRVAIAGSFYCAKASVLREYWMPVGLSVEDGFLLTMVTTRGLTEPVDESRVVRVANATHYFEGVTRIRDLVNHEARLLVGTELNRFLLWDCLYFLTDRKGPGCGDLIRRLNEQDPNWYPRMMGNFIRNQRFFVYTGWEAFRRFRNVSHLPLGQRIVRLPRTILGFCFDLTAIGTAVWRFRTGRAVGYW